MTVLLLEAGDNENPVGDIVAAYPVLPNGPHDWAFKTVPQEEACQALRGNVSSWPRGKVSQAKPGQATLALLRNGMHFRSSNTFRCTGVIIFQITVHSLGIVKGLDRFRPPRYQIVQFEK